MDIRGFQSLTLLDYPGRVACTVFTGGCNFRCPFCHNASLVLTPEANPRFSEEEILAHLKKRRGLLTGLAITGGEPLLQPDLRGFIEKARELGYLIKLDTNGGFPDRLAALYDAGLLDYIAMDIKSSLSGYAYAAGRHGLDTAAVKESAALLMGGKVDFEFRTTIVRGIHTAGDFAQIGEWLGGDEKYFLQGFEDSGDLIGFGDEKGELSAFKSEETEAFAAILRETIPNVKIRGA